MLDGIFTGLSTAIMPFNLLMVVVGCFAGTFRQIRVNHRVTAILHHDHLVVIQLHERQRFRQDARYGLWMFGFRHVSGLPGKCS